MDPSLVAWITGIGAILSAAAGVALIVREFRNKQAKEIHRLDEQLDDTRNELVQYHLYVHELRATMADAGIQSTPPPRGTPGPTRPGVDPTAQRSSETPGEMGTGS